MKKNLKKKKGFTLIELIIVVAILGILALIAIPRFGNAQKNAKIKSDISNAKIIADAVTWVIADGGTVKSGKISQKNNEDLAKKLQSIPTPKYYDGAHFEVEIKNNELEKINVVKGKSGEQEELKVEIYPVPSEGYKQ